MKYNELQAAANKDRIRAGRGISAGRGKTAGRGTKGQKARTGKKLRPMFQGGQRPLAQAIPKNRGFKSLRVPAQVVYMDLLNEFDGQTVDNHKLFENGLVSTPFHSIKVINRGELTAKVELQVQGASKSVVEAIEKAKGSFTKTPTPIRKSEAKAAAEDKK